MKIDQSFPVSLWKSPPLSGFPGISGKTYQAINSQAHLSNAFCILKVLSQANPPPAGHWEAFLGVWHSCFFCAGASADHKVIGPGAQPTSVTKAQLKCKATGLPLTCVPAFPQLLLSCPTFPSWHLCLTRHCCYNSCFVSFKHLPQLLSKTQTFH